MSRSGSLGNVADSPAADADGATLTIALVCVGALVVGVAITVVCVCVARRRRARELDAEVAKARAERAGRAGQGHQPIQGGAPWALNADAGEDRRPLWKRILGRNRPVSKENESMQRHATEGAPPASLAAHRSAQKRRAARRLERRRMRKLLDRDAPVYWRVPVPESSSNDDAMSDSSDADRAPQDEWEALRGAPSRFPMLGSQYPSPALALAKEHQRAQAQADDAKRQRLWRNRLLFWRGGPKKKPGAQPDDSPDRKKRVGQFPTPSQPLGVPAAYEAKVDTSALPAASPHVTALRLPTRAGKALAAVKRELPDVARKRAERTRRGADDDHGGAKPDYRIREEHLGLYTPVNPLGTGSPLRADESSVASSPGRAATPQRGMASLFEAASRVIPFYPAALEPQRARKREASTTRFRTSRVGDGDEFADDDACFQNLASVPVPGDDIHGSSPAWDPQKPQATTSPPHRARQSHPLQPYFHDDDL